jgi:Tfp pilus assembly protein PilO
MFRLITPIILIAVSIAGFVMFVNPMYKELQALKAEAASYDQALTNSKALENERDKLTKKYNAISSDNLDRLHKLLPDSVDNIRLILEIEKVAAPYGMILKDVKYDSAKPVADKNGAVAGGDLTNTGSKNYGSWDLEFGTEGTYGNFLNFIRDLENNLRIIDISTIQFTADSPLGSNKSPLSQTYKYSFRIKTYWMKN